MIKKFVLTAAALMLALAPMAASAQEAVIHLPADSKMVAQMDLQAMRSSGFGKRLISMILDRVMEEIADRAGIAVPDIDDVAGFIGFNPMEEIKTITIAATDFEKAENGVLGIIAMKKTIGSAEAMLPSLPNYSSKMIGDFKVHTVSPDGSMKVHLVIHNDAEGNKTLVVSASEDILKGQLERMADSASAAQNSFAFKPGAGTLVDMHVLEIPADRLGDGPQTIIASMVKQISVKLSEKNDLLDMALGLKAVDGDNADQLGQMLQGIIPMVEGAISEFAKDLKVSQVGDTVTLAMAMESNKVINLLDDQFDTAVGMIEGMLGNR
jgi:hypothetical protein